MMKIVEVLGMPSTQLLDKAPKCRKFFDKMPDGSYVPKKSREGKKVIILDGVFRALADDFVSSEFANLFRKTQLKIFCMI